MNDIHVDYGVLATLRDVMEGEYQNLLNVFLEDSKERVSSLQGMERTFVQPSVGEQSLKTLGMLAHSFKGSSSNMGALRLADFCRELEDLARSNAHVSSVHTRQLILDIVREFQIVSHLFGVELLSLKSRH